MGSFLGLAWETVVAALGAGGALLLFIRYVVRKSVDQAFLRMEKVVDERLALQAQIAKEVSDTQAAVFPALSELVYRATAGAARVRAAGTTIEVLDDELLLACRELTDQLFRIRIYLPKDLFGALHDFKHLLQDLLVLGDYFTRPGAGNAVRELSEEERKRVAFLSDEVSHTCQTIIADLQAHLRSLQGPVALGGS